MTALTSTPARRMAWLEVAEALAREAGSRTLRWFGADPEVSTKGDGSPVTLADRDAEEFLRSGIERRFPTHGIVGEEFGASRADAAVRWIIDPIDGTRSFVRGVPLYAVLVGIEEEGEAVAGVMHFPALGGETLSACVGSGLRWRGGTGSGVSGITDVASALVLTTDPRASMLHPRWGAGWGRLVERAGTVRGWGDAWGHALVATGRAEAMVDPELFLWDAAPILPILREAGGRFTSIPGEARIDGGSGVSSNGRLHDELLGLLNGEGGSG